jgi:hypothetical protein
VKVRAFHAMNKPLPEDPIPPVLPPSYRIRPKTESWAEVLARFEKGTLPPPASSEEPEGTPPPNTPQ